MTNVPKFSDLMWPTLKAIKALGGSASNSEIIDKIIEIENIPDLIQKVQHTTGTMSKLEYNMAWARSYLKKGGALSNSERGVWSITDSGSSLTISDMRQIIKTARTQTLKESRESTENQNISGIDEENWKINLLNILQKLTPSQFERLSQRILRESGFVDVEVTGKTGDGGIDGKGILRVGLLSFKIIFQCKRYKQSVGPETIRDFRGAMQGRADKGLVLTTGSFTRSAKEEARRDGAPPVDLIDGDDFCNLLKQLKLGVAVETTEVITPNQKWFDVI